MFDFYSVFRSENGSQTVFSTQDGRSWFCWNKLCELFRPALFLLSHYPNPSQLDLVYFSVMLKSTPEKEVAVKLQEILSAFVAVTRHQLPGVAVGLRSLAVACNTLRTEGIF